MNPSASIPSGKVVLARRCNVAPSRPDNVRRSVSINQVHVERRQADLLSELSVRISHRADARHNAITRDASAVRVTEVEDEVLTVFQAVPHQLHLRVRRRQVNREGHVTTFERTDTHDVTQVVQRRAVHAAGGAETVTTTGQRHQIAAVNLKGGRLTSRCGAGEEELRDVSRPEINRSSSRSGWGVLFSHGLSSLER